MDESLTYIFFKKIKHYWHYSFIYSFIIKIHKLLSDYSQGSHFFNFFNSHRTSANEQPSNQNFILLLFNKIINWVYRLSETLVNTYTYRLIQLLFTIDGSTIVIYYHFIIISYLTSVIIFSYFFKNINTIIIYSIIGIDVLLSFLLLINSIDLKGSIFNKITFKSINYYNLIQQMTVIAKTRLLIVSMSSFIFGIIALSSNVVLFSIIFIGILGIYLILRYPFLGFYLYIVALPFAGDRTLIFIGLATIISNVFSWFVTKDFTFKKTKYTNTLIVLLTIFTLNTILSINVMGSLRDLLINGVAIFFIIALINNQHVGEQIKKILITLIAVSVVTSFYGFYQFLIGVPMESGWVDPSSRIDVRVFSTFENPNLFAEYLILMIPINVSFLFLNDNRHKVWHVIALLIQLGALGLTFSRGGWLGLMIAIGIFVIIYKPNLLIGLIPAGLISLFFLPTSIINRLKSIVNLTDSSNFYRLKIWEKSVAIVKDFFLTGVGFGFESFREISSFYIKEINPYHAHNTFLEIIIELGIIGLIVYGVLMYQSFKGLKTIQGKTYKTLAIGLFSGLIGLWTHGIAEHIFYNPKIISIFWVTMGLLLFIIINQKEVCGIDENLNDH